mmetsp:Transcript_4619/g.14655  ORF Transcript_4619/g.14655 Transcript_4619/m.14655 type:complete len:251 (-) Transcript_4619:33-785(-)
MVVESGHQFRGLRVPHLDLLIIATRRSVKRSRTQVGRPHPVVMAMYAPKEARARAVKSCDVPQLEHLVRGAGKQKPGVLREPHGAHSACMRAEHLVTAADRRLPQTHCVVHGAGCEELLVVRHVYGPHGTGMSAEPIRAQLWLEVPYHHRAVLRARERLAHARRIRHACHRTVLPRERAQEAEALRVAVHRPEGVPAVAARGGPSSGGGPRGRRWPERRRAGRSSWRWKARPANYRRTTGTCTPRPATAG